MKGRLALLGALEPGVEAAALLVDGRLEDLITAMAGDGGLRAGAVFRARLARRAAGLGAFLDLGEGRRAFLQDAGDGAPGDALLVQIGAYPESAAKAPPAQRRLGFRGRLAALTPDAPGINVSRSVPAERRAALKMAARAALSADAGGLVVRTAAGAASDAALAAEIARLDAEARAVRAGADGPPGLVWAPSPARQLLGDWDLVGADVAAAPGFEAEAELLAEAGAGRAERIEDPFDAFGAAEAVAALGAPDIALPGGGGLIVERAAALIAVDVDAGLAGRAAANRAAAAALPRALRLRGLGGGGVVDFAGGRADGLEPALKSAFAADPVETRVDGWTPAGRLEFTRRRLRRPFTPRA